MLCKTVFAFSYIYGPTIGSRAWFNDSRDELKIVKCKFRLFWKQSEEQKLGMNLPLSQARLKFVKIIHYVYSETVNQFQSNEVNLSKVQIKGTILKSNRNIKLHFEQFWTIGIIYNVLSR